MLHCLDQPRKLLLRGPEELPPFQFLVQVFHQRQNHLQTAA
jgi:hypothetical protein